MLRQLLGMSTAETIDARDYEIVSRRWQQGTWVALAHGREGEKSRQAGLGLYADGNAPSAARVIALSGRLPLANGQAIKDLDLAPYRVAPNKVAIGLRITRSGDDGGSATILRLYLPRGKALAQILSVVTDFACDFIGLLSEDGTRNHFTVTGSSILAVSSKTNNGYSDLVQRADKTALANLAEDIDLGRHPERKPVAVYEWNGSQYQARVSEPDNRTAGVWSICRFAHDGP